jgi:hypothetical protein
MVTLKDNVHMTIKAKNLMWICEFNGLLFNMSNTHQHKFRDLAFFMTRLCDFTWNDHKSILENSKTF